MCSNKLNVFISFVPYPSRHYLSRKGTGFPASPERIEYLGLKTNPEITTVHLTCES